MDAATAAATAAAVTAATAAAAATATTAVAATKILHQIKAKDYFKKQIQTQTTSHYWQFFFMKF